MLRSIKTTLATIVVPGVFCFLVPALILNAYRDGLIPAPFLLRVFAALIMICGLAMVVWVSDIFVRKGKGTPIPLEPPTQLVIEGLYRHVRNPMYVGAVLILLGEVILFRSGWLLLYSAGLWSALHIFLVKFEEPQLIRRYGMDFIKYLETVPRWIPKIPVRDA
jgi:protein-S-isoprenylcysteine O-methyltransferase Ste14